MKEIDYSDLTTITIKTQKELDAVPLDFEGRIYVKCDRDDWLQIRHNYRYPVEVYGNSSVEIFGNSSIRAFQNSTVAANDDSSVRAYNNASIGAFGNSSIVVNESASVKAYENSFVIAFENSFVEAYESASVRAYEDSFVKAFENSFVMAFGNSTVKAFEDSSIMAYGNTQVIDYLQGAKIQISDNARIVYNPRTIYEFLDFFGIKHDKKKAKFYKAVHYDGKNYFSNFNSTFIYVIGDIVKEECDPDVEEDCSNGIHISTLNWALGFGEDWDDLAILELETDIDKIVLLKNSDGKVRTSEAKVLREVPLEECGLYGKILAKNKGRI
jgi:hypothetical protein